MILVACALVYYLWRNGHHIVEMVRSMPVWRLVAAWACILAGKAAAFHVMSASLRLAAAEPLPWRTRTWIYSSADVSKYAGGVWALLGRLIHYRDHGLSVAQISYALVLENGTLLATGVLCGAPVLLLLLLPRLTPFALLSLVAAGVVGVAAAITVLRARRVSLAVIVDRSLRMMRSAAVMLAGWICMGTSMYLVLPEASTLNQWLWSVGAYASAFAAGMMAFFAPAGAGVREGVLVLAAHVQELPHDVVLNAAIVNRALWVVADFFLFGVVALGLRKR